MIERARRQHGPATHTRDYRLIATRLGHDLVNPITGDGAMHEELVANIGQGAAHRGLLQELPYLALSEVEIHRTVVEPLAEMSDYPDVSGVPGVGRLKLTEMLGVGTWGGPPGARTLPAGLKVRSSAR